jgi:hypothetical protein
MQYALTVQARVRTSHNRVANRSSTSDYQLLEGKKHVTYNVRGSSLDYYTAICHDSLNARAHSTRWTLRIW